MPVIYEPATPEEVATVMLAFYAKGPIPTGYAVNLNWDPPVRKIAGFSGDPPAPVYSPEAVFLNTRMDGLESGLDAKADATALDAKANVATVTAVNAVADRADTRVLDVRAYGAVGGGLGTTVAQAGESIAAIRTETGQAWLQTTDSMDLVAFYRAQAQAEATGRTVVFPRDRYVFTAPGFLHAGVRVDLDGSTITNINANESRFVRANRVFLLGILAREDYDRFDAQGWAQTASDIALDARQLTNLTGPAPSVGDVLLIRTTAASLTPTLPAYVTFNEVTGVAGTTVTLRYPVERAIAAPKVVNYSTITTLKSTLVGTGEPHRYYAAKGASLVNGTLVATDGPAYEVNAALDCDIDVRISAPKGSAVYGNGLNRCRVRTAGLFGGPKGAIETGTGSALSTIDCDLRFSGDTSDSSGAVSGAYAHVQIGEYAEQITVRGRIDAGNKPGSLGVTFPLANRSTVNVDMVGRGVTGEMVAFPSNAGTGNRVHGRYEIAGAAYYARWNAGTGTNNWLENATFAGDQSTAYALAFMGPSLGGARGITAPEGLLHVEPGASGNIVIDSYIREGLPSSGPNGSQIAIRTAAGPWPEDGVIVAHTTSGNQTVGQSYGRTLTNTGATAAVARLLPAAVPGMVVRGYRTASFQLKLRPQPTETVGTGAAGKAIQLDSDNAFVELRCLSAGHWVVAQSAGATTYEP